MCRGSENRDSFFFLKSAFLRQRFLKNGCCLLREAKFNMALRHNDEGISNITISALKASDNWRDREKNEGKFYQAE